MNSNHHEAVKDESRCISECEDESFKSEGNALFEITQQVSTNSTFNIQMDHTNHKAIFPNMETTHGVSEKNDNRDCFDFDQLLHAEFTENTNITLAPALKNEETLLEGDAYEFNDTGKEKDDNSFSNTCNLQIVKPVQNYKATIDKVESSSKVLNESDFMPSFSNQSKIILCSKKTIEDSAVPKFFSSNVLDQNTANVNYCSSSPVSTNSNNLDSVHVIKNQPLIMSAKPLLSEITQTTAKVSIGNTTISVPLLKPVCTPKYVQDATDINKNPKSKLSYQQSRKLFSQINSKNSTTLSVNRGQKINPPTIVSLSQLQIKPSNNAKIVQATVVSNKLHLHSSVDVPTQSALITTPIRVKPNCTQKFVYPKQVNVSNDNANQSQQTEEVQLSLKHKLSVFSELKKTATKESFSESENQIQCNFSSSVINKKGLQSSESLMISDKFLDSISTAVKQNMQAKSRLESLSDAASLENNIASEISPIIPSLISPIEMSINKTFQKSSALREGGRQITTTSTSGATTGITAVYATSTAPISDRIVTPSIANSCTLSKKSVTSFLNIPRTLSLMLSKNTANQNTSTVMPMIIGDQSTISRCITDRITKNNQFPKTITLKKTENVNSQRYRPTPIHLIPINTSLTQVNIEKSSELLDLPCEHKDLGLTLKNKHINKDSENLNLLTHNTTLQQVNNSTYSAVSKNQQDDKILETTQNSMIFSTISDDMKTLSTENCLTSNTIHEPKLNSHKTNEVESSSKIEDSQNILLKQLLKNSSLNNNLSMSSMTAAQTSICSQVLSSRKIINVRAPSLGLVSSLEAQLARPVIPPVPATTGVTRSNCIAVEPINKQLDHNTNILDCKVKQPIKIISKETSFVSNPKFCSSTYTNRTALDEVSSYPSLDVNTTNADRMLDKVSELRSSPSEEFFSSFKGKLKLQNSGADFLNLSEKNVTSDEKMKLTLYEVADFLRQLEEEDSENEDDQNTDRYNVFMQPPDVEYDSGGDDANEDVGDVQLDQLHFNQFNQIIDLDLPVLEGQLHEESDQEMADEEPSTSAAAALNTIRTSTSFSAPTPNTKWAYVGKNIDIPSKESCPGVSTNFKYHRQGTKLNATIGGIFPMANYQDCAVSAHEIFERFFDDELCQMIVDCTNEYAVFKNAVNPNITVNELRVFMGILLISGYSIISDREDYWSQNTDMHNPMISAAMTRQRFRTISRYLHFSRSTDENRHDKMWKLRPLMIKLIANFDKNFRPEQHLSYDESMVAYYGPHSCKQFLREKPIRYGYKVWCMNTPSGYLLSFEVYQGNNPYIHPYLGRNYGKNAAPLLQMIFNLPDELRILPFCFYFDNLFTNIALLAFLKSLGYHGTGTCRDNFLPKNLPIMKKKDMKKYKERGYMEGTIIQDYDISITTWRDNNAVTVASTLFDRYPDATCERFSLKAMGYIPLPRPNVIAMYNKYMGGVDRMDQNIGFYRIEIRKNKWWWALWTWCLDVAVQNAWVQQRHSSMSNVTHLQFRRNIATYYCTQLSLRIQHDQTQRRFNKGNDARLDGLEHWVVPCNRRHCAYYRCKSQARTKCEKCDVGLCGKCFKAYHNTTN